MNVHHHSPRPSRKLAGFLVGTLLGGVPLMAAAAQEAVARPTAARVAAAVDSIADSLTRGPVVGMSVVVARGPDILLAKGYGMADREEQQPATAQTVYQIGSITKQFTAAAVMRLVEQGRLALSDSVTRFLSDFPTQGRMVTIQQLLNHTSGIRSYTSFMPLTDSISVAQIYDSIKVQPFDFEPGTDYRYNNSGYLLLGLILEQVTGQEYAALMRDWFFTPLGLNDTRYCGADGVAPPTGYRPGLMDARMRVLPVDMRGPFSAGALCSTAPDLARWTWALASGEVVRPESFAAMSGGSVLSTGRKISYGYGLAADTAHGRPFIHHGGGIPGFVTEAGIFPGDSTILVVLLNTEGNIRRIAERVREAALGGGTEGARKPE